MPGGASATLKLHKILNKFKIPFQTDQHQSISFGMLWICRRSGREIILKKFYLSKFMWFSSFIYLILIESIADGCFVSVCC